MDSIVHALSSLPSTDGNFLSCLCRANNEQILEAIEVMKSSNGKHKMRLKECEKELRKRGRK